MANPLPLSDHLPLFKGASPTPPPPPHLQDLTLYRCKVCIPQPVPDCHTRHCGFRPSSARSVCSTTSTVPEAAAASSNKMAWGMMARGMAWEGTCLLVSRNYPSRWLTKETFPQNCSLKWFLGGHLNCAGSACQGYSPEGDGRMSHPGIAHRIATASPSRATADPLAT